MKPPAFLFYPDSFLGGTVLFTCEETGAYIRLLCYQWDLGFLPNSVEKLAELARCSQYSINAILFKFEICDDGKLRNKRMEAERIKQAEYRAAKSSNGKTGAYKRWNGTAIVSPLASLSVSHSLANGVANGTAIVSPMANTMAKNSFPSPFPSPKEEVHELSKKKEKKTTATLDEVVAYCVKNGIPKTDGECCFHKWEGNGWTNGGRKIVCWKATIRSWRTAGYLPSQKPGSPTADPESRKKTKQDFIKVWETKHNHDYLNYPHDENNKPIPAYILGEADYKAYLAENEQ